MEDRKRKIVLTNIFGIAAVIIDIPEIAERCLYVDTDR